MKLNIYILAGIIILLSACSQKDKYDPSKTLSNKEQQQVLLSTVRYFGHLPKKGTHDNKFDSNFDEYYSKLVSDFTMEAYYQKDGLEYFLISRIAPSIKVKKVATGIKMKRDKDGAVTHYEEVFRTWKFETAEMLEKSLMLFDKMVQDEDLSPYFPQNSGIEEYIEFPDEKVFFDNIERRWKV
ncbi:hypothetical protein, partial [Cecembia sp.]